MWTEAARFDEGGETIVLINEVAAWSGGFIATGASYPSGTLAEDSEVRVWTSTDGRSWEDEAPDVGADATIVSAVAIPGGGLLVFGSVEGSGGAAEYSAWKSDDGQTWSEVSVPSEWAAVGFQATSGPIGIVVTVGNVAWYSADGESWQSVLQLPAGGEFGRPSAGEEGFVVHASAGDVPVTYASGDGITWVEGSRENVPYQIAAWRGDWFGWVPTSEPGTFSVARSANGLDWTLALDERVPSRDGPQTGAGGEPITHAEVHGEGGVVALTLGFNHCCAQPPLGIDVLISEDGEAWTDAGLPDSAYVTDLATNGEVVVMAGHLDRGSGGAALWVADR